MENAYIVRTATGEEHTVASQPKAEALAKRLANEHGRPVEVSGGEKAMFLVVRPAERAVPWARGKAPPPPEARPRCIACGRALRPLVKRDYVPGTIRPVARRWEGGYEGKAIPGPGQHPLVCTLRCAERLVAKRFTR